tara:strand:- start:91 stop:282 length:192 start_codon:yes stop_codon:yes gene_type:complete
MKVNIWIKIEDLEEFDRVINRDSRIEKRFKYEYCEIIVDSVMITIDYEDYVYLKDNNLIYINE